MYKKKLIETSIPLDEINAQAVREKSIRKGHPSTLHLWWARRPLATARAVIWSSLVDDPSSHPEQFPTEEEQQKAIYNPYRAMDVFRLYSEFHLPIHLSEVSIPSWSNEAGDEEVQAELVERLLGVKVKKVEYPELEKTI